MSKERVSPVKEFHWRADRLFDRPRAAVSSIPLDLSPPVRAEAIEASDRLWRGKIETKPWFRN
jgi:hypothetical protein